MVSQSAELIKYSALFVSSPAIYFAWNSQYVVIFLMDFMVTKKQVQVQEEFFH